MSFPAFFPTAHKRIDLQRIFSQRVAPRLIRSAGRLAAAAVLAVSALAALPLNSQTAHFSGAIVALGSRFGGTAGVSVDGNGNVFVADLNNNAVKEILAADGYATIKTLGSGFNTPEGVAVDGRGNVFVADSGNSAVKEILAAGGYTTVKTLASGFSRPNSVALDGHGNVFVTDGDSIKEILAAGGYTTVNALGGAFALPEGVAVDGNGNVFVADTFNNAVKEILAAGGYTTINTLGSGFNFHYPSGVGVDGSGNVYVTSSNPSAVYEILAASGYTTVNTLGLGTEFPSPAGVAVDGMGNVFVAGGEVSITEIEQAGGSFGPLAVGSTSAVSAEANFTFDTSGTLGSTAVLTQGISGLDFTDEGADTCLANTAYNAGDTCHVSVNFTPGAPGLRYGAVELLDGSGNVIATGPVQGTGVGPLPTFATLTAGAYLPSAETALGSGSFGFQEPTAVAADAAGNIFVVDATAGSLSEIPAAGGYTTAIPLSSGFSYPQGVALDGSGNVYLSDTSNDSVEEILAASGYTTVKTLPTGFGFPYGVAVDGYGNVYVSDFSSGAVEEMLAVSGSIPASPTIVTLASGLGNLGGVTIDGSGDVFVSNYHGGQIYKIVAVNGRMPASPVIKTIATDVLESSGIAADAAGNIFLPADGSGFVEEIVAAGGYTRTRLIGSGFAYPFGVAVDGRGDVIVGDIVNGAVDFLDYADAAPLSFPSTAVGSVSLSQVVSVSNEGNAPLNDTFSITGTDASEFVFGNSCNSLAAGAQCTIHGHFAPTYPGAASAAVSILNNDTKLTQTIPLSGIVPGPALSASSLWFGQVGVGSWSASQWVSLSNPKPVALSISSIVLTGTDAAQFVLGTTCGSTLGGGANCFIHVHFQPTAQSTVSFSAAVTIIDSASNSPQTIALSGEGTFPQHELALSTTRLVYGTVSVGADSSPQSVIMTNISSTPVTIYSIALAGTNPSSFVVANNCGTSLAAGASCVIHGHFAPTATGPLAATITVTYDSEDTPETITLRGTGQ